jgi:D-lactate dehydrogenase (cytochrome)
MTQSFFWYELMTSDPKAATAFYSDLVGWTPQPFGDGNFHIAYLIDPTLPAERATAERLNARLVGRAIAAGGTCTGEHGIGLHKQGFLVDEAGEGAIEMMRQVKRALDPHDLMNPGKIFAR